MNQCFILFLIEEAFRNADAIKRQLLLPFAITN